MEGVINIVESDTGRICKRISQRQAAYFVLLQGKFYSVINVSILAVVLKPGRLFIQTEFLFLAGRGAFFALNINGDLCFFVDLKLIAPAGRDLGLVPPEIKVDCTSCLLYTSPSPRDCS